METSRHIRFMGWKDLVITPAVEVAILVMTFLSVLLLNRLVSASLFANAISFYLLMLFWTLLTLKIIRVIIPINEGVYSYGDNSLACYIWNLHAFLCITNLSLHYNNGLLPPAPMRKFFYILLGAKMGRGVIAIGGKLLDPSFITIGENTIIGEDALLTPHAVARTSSDILIIGKIEIKRGVIIGARSMIMPGVTIGENSMVNAMSLVPMNTKIPPNQIWGGNPAVKIADLSKAGT